jgi:uncharacterized protein (DUF3084 family)
MSCTTTAGTYNLATAIPDLDEIRGDEEEYTGFSAAAAATELEAELAQVRVELFAAQGERSASHEHAEGCQAEMFEAIDAVTVVENALKKERKLHKKAQKAWAKLKQEVTQLQSNLDQLAVGSTAC